MGGGSSAPSQPSTTTTVQDIPAWEQGYVENLLGQAQTIAAQPYQQFPGPQVAGFTDDQNQAFSNIENATGSNINNQNAAMGQAVNGANSANSIYNAGSGDINAATSYNPLAAVSPYLGAAGQYNSAAAAQPGLNQAMGYNAAAAGVATPQGIQSYMSPYTNDVVQGLQNTANQNWNQNIMPGVNNEFVGSGQFGSGRNAQVLGQAANNFQTNLDTSVANALQSGYTTAGNQAATEAGILGNSANTAISGANAASNAQTGQVNNLLNQANAAGTATQQQAGNLNTAGVNLGNLANTQAGQQINAGTAIGALGAQSANTNLQQNQALQAVGQAQQNQNQTNINAAIQNWTNQTQWPAQQTEYLNQIIRGLPAPTAATSSSQVTPATSVSPLSAIGGSSIAGLSLLGSNGQSVGQVAKKGGLIKGYAEGGQVGTYTEDEEDPSPLSLASLASDENSDDNGEEDYAPNPLEQVDPEAAADKSDESDDNTPAPNPLEQDAEEVQQSLDSEENTPKSSSSQPMITPEIMQQQELLALARGMLTPTPQGSTPAALGLGLGNMADVQLRDQQLMSQQNNLNYQRQQEARKIDIEQQKANALKQNADTNASYKGSGGAAMNKVVQVIGPDGKPTFATAKDAINKNLTSATGFKPTTLSPAAIDMYADAMHNGAKGTDLGLGYGMNGDKKAVMDRLVEKYPDTDLAGAQTQLIGERAGAKTVGSTTGKIEFASQSLGSMIPLAKQASQNIDRTEYPTINAIQNAVEKGTGDQKIIALNTYLNAVMSDHAALLARTGASTDAARSTAHDMANAALSKGQLNTYFDSVENEIKAQRQAGKNTMSMFSNKGAAATPANSQPLTKTLNGVTYTKVNGQWIHQ